MSAFFDSSYEKVGDLLSRQITFRVPEHQRDYSWTEDEVSQFWDDVWHAVQIKGDHFLGPSVLRKSDREQEFEIIDGQQRLTTTLILLAVLRNVYGERADPLASTLQSTYFGHVDRRTRDVIPKFFMNTNNNSTFKEFIIEQKPMKDFVAAERDRKTKFTNKNLLRAYVFLKRKIDEVTGVGSAFNSDILADVEDFIRERLTIIRIVVSDEADAFALFETLNERGIELSILDLLKNHLFKHATAASRELVKARWIEMITNLDENAGSKFIRHFWVARNGRVQAGRLYREIRDSARTRAEVLRLSENLVEDSRLYTALSQPDDEIWDEHSQMAKTSIATLRLLNASQCMPVLMAAYRRMSKDNFDKVLRLMAVMAVRYSLICQYRTGALEIAYADLANKISHGAVQRAGSARQELADIYPRDEEFASHFRYAEINTAKHARYILRELESQRNNGVLLPNIDPANVNLEHIAPKAQNQHWSSISVPKGDNYRSWSHRIGNLVLLEKGANTDLGGADFVSKKKAFSHSSISLTNEIANSVNWTTKEIESRQNMLAELAVLRWRYDI